MKLRLRHITTGLQRPSFPSITHADLSPLPISSRKQHLLCTICRTLAVPFTLPFLLSFFLFFFSFSLFLCSFLEFFRSIFYIVLARSSLFFLLFRLVLVLSSGFLLFRLFLSTFFKLSFLFRSIENRSKIEIASFR